MKQIIGQQGDKSCAQNLYIWLRDWHKNHQNSKLKNGSTLVFIIILLLNYIEDVLYNLINIVSVLKLASQLVDKISKLPCYPVHQALVKQQLYKLFVKNWDTILWNLMLLIRETKHF